MSNLFKSKLFLGVMVAVVMLAGVVALAPSQADAQTACTITTTLRVGSRGAQVACLQAALGLTADGAFGPKTKAAVIAWQKSKGLVADGIFGAKSRAAWGGAATGNFPVGCTSASGYSPVTGQPCVAGPSTGLPAGCSTTSGYSALTGQPCNGTGTPQTGSVTASLAANNPAAGTVVAGQATADLAHFTFNGTGTVTGVQLMRTGVSANDTLSNVYLYDGAMRLTDAASVTSSGMVTFANPAGLFTVSGSRTISVRADIKASTSGQTVGVMLSNFTVMGQTAATVANLSGNLMTVAAAADLATVIMPTTNTVVSASVDAGTSNYTVWGNTVQVGQRSVWLKGATFRVIGSAESGALQNARLVVDGAQVGTPVASVTANGNLSFDLSAAPVSLATGSHTIEVRADVVGGANRNVYLALQNAGDLMLTDSQYNVNVMLQNTGPVAFTMNQGGTITINAGTLSLSKDTTFNSTTTVTSGASNVTVGRYTLRAYGEAVKVMQVKVEMDLGTGTEGLNNVGLYLNGAQVGTSQNGDDQDVTFTFNLGSSLIVPAGQTATLEVRADMQDETNDNYTGTVTTQVVIPVGQAQGQTSFDTYPDGTPLTSATTVVTAGAATANVTKSSGFLTTTVGTNVANARVGSYVITAGTTEALRVTNLAVSIDQTLGSATTGDVELTDIANLRAVVTVAGQAAVNLNAVNPQATNNFSTDFTIPAGSTATVDVYVDVTNATASETIQTNLLITARGASSNVVLTSGTGIASAQAGQELTVGAGALLNTTGITVVSSNATSQRYVVGNSAIEPIIRYSVKPTSGAVTIEELTFTLAGTSNVITALSVTGTSGGSACSVSVPSGATSVTITGCSIPVPYTLGGTDLIVTPTINFVGINGISSGTGVTATVDLTAVQYNDGTTSVDATLDGADDADDLANTAVSNAVRPVASLPTLTLTGSNAILANGEIKVGSVTISASAGGNINLETLPVTFALGGGALTNDATDVFVVKEGNTTVVTTDNAANDAASGAAVITFTNDEVVVAGSSRTFDIYMKIDTVTGGDDTAQISLAPSSAFLWDDINGGGDNLVGTYILNYPTSTVTIQD